MNRLVPELYASRCKRRAEPKDHKVEETTE